MRPPAVTTSPFRGKAGTLTTMPVCAQCGTDNPDIAKFCLACGSPLADAPPPVEVRKTVTIVFSDLKGSTAMGERLDSEAVREVMSRYFDTMRAELERHGGVVEKYIGDAIMAVFGLPKLHEDDALRAVRAAFGMQRALAELNEELDRRWGVRLGNRTGVNTGEVVAGDPTTGQRLVTGDTVNVAARLEQAAGEREVLLGELTYRLVRDAVEVEDVEPLELKGKSERVPAYRLVSVAETGEGWQRRSDAPMVGREEELAIMHEMFVQAVAARSPRLVTVVADAGAGKSRLNDEFLHTVTPRAQVLRGRCLSYGEGITFWPLVEVVRQAAAIREDDSPEAAREKLAAVVGEDGGDVADRVSAAIGLGTEQFSIDEIFWGIRKFLERLAQAQPLVILFDDIHWAEPTFLELVENLLESLEDAPVLLLCPARHELLEHRPDWAWREDAARIVLEPLTGADIEAIIENLLGEAGIAKGVQERIVAAADGNPLFVEQMLSMLIDRELLRFEKGHWTATADLADISVPPTIQALLASRLDGLAVNERAVVEPASVIGHVFATHAVEALVADAVQPEVPARLGDLERKQLVKPDLSAFDEERFRFGHVLIRDAAYNGLLKRARATFHERFVEWADRVNRERGREAEYEEILGYHLEQAHRYLSELGPLDEHGQALGADGARRLTAAGRRAFERGDAGAAANLLGRAVALLGDEDPTRLELLPDVGEALLLTGQFAEAEAALGEAIAAAERQGLDALRAQAALVRLLVQLRADAPSDWHEQVLRESSSAIEIFERTSDDAGLTKAWRLLTWAYGMNCQFGAAANAAEQAFEHAIRAGDTRQQSRIATAYPMAALLGPTPVTEAIERSEHLVEQVSRDRASQAVVLGQLAALRALEGSFEKARSEIARAYAIVEELGLHAEVAGIDVDAWRVEIAAGDLEAAERTLRHAYEIFDRMGEKYLLSTVAGLLAQTLYAKEQYDEVESLGRKVQELASDDDIETQALWRCVQAKALARSGDFDDAERLVNEALALVAQTDASILEHGTLLDLAEVQRLAGKTVGMATTLETAIVVAERKGSRVMVESARRLLLKQAGTPLPTV
jgi:class 3 adenylate cyclase/tetratricopeptide (TPR) repeat protein